MKKRRNKRKLQKTCFFYKKYGKRLMDIILSFLGIIVLSPIMLITAFLVRMRLGSPVIFRQKRPGKNENIFEMYKFRTMTDTKDQDGNLLPDDVRLTSFGKKLRSASIDELPELFNILKGDMSVVAVSYTHLLMLVGTVVNNGILYVDTANQYRSDMDRDTALIEAGATRLRPILMTTLTTIVAMIPMALGIGDSGEMMQGMALVNVGGLLASTSLSLLMLPIYYTLMNRGHREELDVD